MNANVMQKVEEKNVWQLKEKLAEIGLDLPIGYAVFEGTWGVIFALVERIKQLEDKNHER